MEVFALLTESLRKGPGTIAKDISLRPLEPCITIEIKEGEKYFLVSHLLLVIEASLPGIMYI